VLSSWTEDAAGFHVVGLAEELDGDGHAIVVACPPGASGLPAAAPVIA